MAERPPAPLRLGLVGWPLRRSLSPLVHRLFLEETGMAGEYGLYPLDPASLRAGVLGLAAEGLAGLNVTIPHKQAALRLCDRLDRTALAAGAVNTLSFLRGEVAGANTDAAGFRRTVEELALPGPFLLAGGGGAALAAAAALAEMGLAHRVFCRRPGTNPRGTVRGEGMDLLEEALRGLASGTLVNATPLGWADGDSFPVEPTSLEGITFLDLNYNPRWGWRNALAGTAASVHTGETMLVFQAVESFRLWTGTTPPSGAALAAARAWMGSAEGAGS